MKNFLMNTLFASVCAVLLIIGSTFVVYPAITGLSGLAVAQSSVRWNNVRDAAVGDNLTNGVLAMSMYLFDGTNFDRIRGDITNGMDVDVIRLAGIVSTADNSANPTNKLPVLPCVAQATLPTYTTGNIVPCTSSTTGATFVTVGGGYQGSGLVVWGGFQTQAFSLFNTQTTGAANTAVVATIAAAANVRAQLYSIEAQCSAGTSTITVQDGATTIFTSMGANVPAALATYRRDWNTPLTGNTNTAMTVTLAACGVGNTGTLSVQASRF